MGASVAHGGWLKGGEDRWVPTHRNATVLTVESELSFRYTKLQGEWVRNRLDTDVGIRVASGVFVQAQQTLAPRWFVAGRVERISTPVAMARPAGAFVEQRLSGVEETLGYRVTSDLTLRLSHRAHRTVGAKTYAQTAAVSIVWWKRLM